MASHSTIRELTIAELRLHEDDEIFADAVACVQAYWSQASQMNAESQEAMRQLIINKDYTHTDWSRKYPTKHRLYRTERRDCSAWPAFLILNALYKELPSKYTAGIKEKNLPTALEDHTDDYLAVFPNTVLPTLYDTNTPEGEAYREAWPKLRNTPTIYRKEERGAAASSLPVRRPSSAPSSLSTISSSAAPPAFSTTTSGVQSSGSLLNLLSRSPFATTPSTKSPAPCSALPPRITSTALPQTSPASQQTSGHLKVVEPETQHVCAFSPARFILSPASSTNLSETPAPGAVATTTTAAPSASTQTAIQLQRTQRPVHSMIEDADAEECVNPPSRRKRSPPDPTPTVPNKRQNTNEDTFESMIQRLQSPAITSAKPKPAADAVSKLEKRVDVFENQTMAVLVAMTDEIKMLKDKVAALENA